jgi:hypothetical protein
VAPGSYRSDGPTGSNPVGCYYAILDAQTRDIITNNITTGPRADHAEGGPAVRVDEP